MKAKAVILLIFSVLLLSTIACGGSGSEPTPTPTPTPTSTQEPTPGRTPTKCEADRDAIQVALDAYHEEEGEWPTADSGPGDIEWNKLVPVFLDAVPSTDRKCDWRSALWGRTSARKMIWRSNFALRRGNAAKGAGGRADQPA